MTYTKYLLTGLLLILFITFANAQNDAGKLAEIEDIVKKEGDLFIAIDRVRPESDKPCLEENTITNTVQFTADSAFVNYINYTELFCEVYVMRTQYTYHFDIKDIDPATIRLVEKKYNMGSGKLKEGKPGWFEVQLFSRDNQKTILRRDIDNKQIEQVSTVSLIVGEKEAAKKVSSLLKSHLQARQHQ